MVYLLALIPHSPPLSGGAWSELSLAASCTAIEAESWQCSQKRNYYISISCWHVIIGVNTGIKVNWQNGERGHEFCFNVASFLQYLQIDALSLQDLRCSQIRRATLCLERERQRHSSDKQIQSISLDLWTLCFLTHVVFVHVRYDLDLIFCSIAKHAKANVLLQKYNMKIFNRYQQLLFHSIPYYCTQLWNGYFLKGDRYRIPNLQVRKPKHTKENNLPKFPKLNQVSSGNRIQGSMPQNHCLISCIW